MSLRERNKADKLARIKRAAKSLFEKRGFEATTTKEIADTAGVATGTIFLYAKTKDEILYIIFEDEITRVITEGFSQIPSKASAIEGAYVVFSALFRYYAGCPELARSFIRRFVFIDPEMSERYLTFQATFLERLARLVIDSQVRGETRSDADPLLIAGTLFSIYGSSLVFFLQTEPLDLERGLVHLRTSLALLGEGVCGKGRAP